MSADNLEQIPDGDLSEVERLKKEVEYHKEDSAMNLRCADAYKKRADEYNSKISFMTHELAKLRGKVHALTQSGDAMDMLLTGSMKPSKGVREAWDKAKQL